MGEDGHPDSWDSWEHRNILKNLYSQTELQEKIALLDALSPTIRRTVGVDRESGGLFLPDFYGPDPSKIMLIYINHFKPSHAERPQDGRLMTLHGRRRGVLIEPCLEFEVMTLAKTISYLSGSSLEKSRLWVLNHVMFMNVIPYGMYYHDISLLFCYILLLTSHSLSVKKRYASINLSQRPH